MGFRWDFLQPHNRTGCCARSVLAQQPNFLQQKGRLEEELEAAHQLVIFIPNFTASLALSFGVHQYGMPEKTVNILFKVYGSFYLPPLTLSLLSLLTATTIIIEG